MEIDFTRLDFYEWPPPPPHVACGSQLGPFSPLLISLSLFSSYTLSSLTHNFPQLSHNTHLNNTLSQVTFLQYWEYFLLVNIVVIC